MLSGKVPPVPNCLPVRADRKRACAVGMRYGQAFRPCTDVHPVTESRAKTRRGNKREQARTGANEHVQARTSTNKLPGNGQATGKQTWKLEKELEAPASCRAIGCRRMPASKGRGGRQSRQPPGHWRSLRYDWSEPGKFTFFRTRGCRSFRRSRTNSSRHTGWPSAGRRWRRSPGRTPGPG